MNGRSNVLNRSLFFVLVLVLIFAQWPSSHSLATMSIKLIMDGKDITSLSSPIIENGRTLVPIRFIAEELEAEVIWNEKDRTVAIEKDGTSVLLRIDSHLITYENGDKSYGLSDVSPKIIDSRTYVPLRLVSNALGIGIEWDEANKFVSIDSSNKSDITPFFDLEILNLKPGQAITGKTNLQIELGNTNIKNAKDIKYLLLDPETAQGTVVARGNQLTNKYSWLPNLQDKGEKVLVAALYDDSGKFLAGDAIPVYIDINPKVSLTGVKESEILDDTIYLGADTNFVASYVEYEITKLDTDEINLITEQDPQGQYKWEPKIGENGDYSFKVRAYDGEGKSYESETITAKVQVEPKLTLTGVLEGQTIDKPVNLLASRNFDVSETEYILRDPNTGKEETIAKMPYGNHRWFPGPKLSGKKEVLVRVKDTRGVSHESKPISVILKGKPILLLEGVGPNQVLREAVDLKIRSNINLDSVNYIFTREDTAAIKIIGADKDSSEEQTYTPTKEDEGFWNIKAIGKYNGKEISSESIPIRVYLGETYPTSAIIEKDKFLGLASELAKESWKKTGMSAALQTAQSILESGWGQSVPVDKYSGKVSYNLFGIKGKGPAGTVTYNTWEVYNGQTYYVDARFRAYNNVEESWTDHKNFLLDSSRYEPFTKVMHDSTQGAWALKRSGYATDPQYALKLMRIIKQYNLQELDKVKI